MTPKAKPLFDPKLFLAKVGEGRKIVDYSKNQVVFSQEDRADAIFHIQKGKVKLTVVSNAGKEAIIAILAKKRSSPSWIPATSLARNVWRAERCACQPPPRCRTARSCDWRKRP